MRAAIIGAGVGGLVTARVLRDAGIDVVVYEKAPDIGGVWSRTRSYPGVSTQDDRRTYSYSDMPMPDSFPEHPTGADVRGYLQNYASVHKLQKLIRLRTAVLSADLLPDDAGWTITSEGPGGIRTDTVDWLVAANGVYSNPYVPDWPGRDQFAAAGGSIVSPSSLGDGSVLAGRSVVVVGWGKTACDVAAVSSARARTTAVVVREVRWKLPKRITARLTFRHLLLTRLGEHIIFAPYRSRATRLLRIVDRIPRLMVGAVLARIVSRQLGLDALGLRPRVPFSDCNSLVTEGFYEAVQDGRIAVQRNRSVVGLLAVDGVPSVELSDGTVLPAQIVIPGTGFDQRVEFLAPGAQARLLDEHGDLRLHRRILALDVPRLAFIGWTQSYRSPLTAEIGAIWLAAHLQGAIALPSEAVRRRRANVYHLSHARAASSGGPQLPSGSFGELDAMLEDLHMPLPRREHLRQMVTPINPSSYAYLLPRLLARKQPATSTAPPLATPVAMPSNPSPSGT